MLLFVSCGLLFEAVGDVDCHLTGWWRVGFVMTSKGRALWVWDDCWREEFGFRSATLSKDDLRKYCCRHGLTDSGKEQDFIRHF